jgi:hypothetical protein
MGGPGQLEVGRPVTVAGASATVILPRSGQLLGFFASVSQTIALNDAATTATAASGNQILNASACAVGFNPFPIDLVNGLVATAGTGNITYVIT